MKEIWKPIPGWEELYEVSDQGRVWSARLDRVLRPAKIPNRYPVVSWSLNGERFSFTVHKLVTLSFLGPRPEGKEVDHINGDKSNNRLSNLRYVSKSENLKAAIVLGNFVPKKGQYHARAKLSDRQIMEIRRLFLEGMGQKRIAKEFGVSQQYISNLVNGRNRRLKTS